MKPCPSQQVEVRRTWRSLIHRLTQERSTWHDPAHAPRSWKLDPTEGPSRVRRRMQPCHLKINPQLFQDGATGKVLTALHLMYCFSVSFFLSGSFENKNFVIKT
jgi:hypothetical protein